MPFQLRYLFGVQYADGSEFFQTPEDVSSQDPKRSAFYDVRQEDVRLFQLLHVDDSRRRYVLDLSDGHLEVDGVPLFGIIPPPEARLRLIYFRRHRHHFQTGPGLLEELSHEVEYHFGWQAEVDGQNIKQIFVVI